VATLSSLGSRLRTEIGDIGKSFVYQFTADGTTNRFLIPYSPLDGLNLSILQDGANVSADVEVEEATGYIVFDTTPADGDVIVVAGNHYRYFTDNEIEDFVSTAFTEHSAFHTDAYGRTVSLQNLPVLEEYPVVVYSATLALYALANDAAFDINVFAPDGVTIPRSERYQQLMQMVQARQNQYRELCSQLGIGMYKIDVFSLRRISKTTNRYVPIFQPMEVDDRDTPTRVYVPIPTYGGVEAPVTAIVQDLYVYEGDDYTFNIVFDFELDNYTPTAEIRQMPGSSALITSFTITKPDVGSGDGAGLRTLQLDLTEAQTRMLPGTSYYDIQMVDQNGVTKTYVTGKIFKTKEVTVP
jgi:hypothetical protein